MTRILIGNVLKDDFGAKIQIIKLYSSYSDNQTYASPAFKDDADIQVTYIKNAYYQLDNTRINVKGKFPDIVEDSKCKKVESIGKK